jgi:LPXTG-motif cell wall-anchored protein
MLRTRESKGGVGMRRPRWSSITFAAAYIALVVGIFLALGGAAYAQAPSSASDQYGTKVKGVKVSAVKETAVASESQALPNTGLSLLGVVVVGGALVAGGLVLRRREQRKS